MVEALKNHTHPERLSALVQPAPFDVAKFKADPTAYANEVVPGRVFQSAAPGPNGIGENWNFRRNGPAYYGYMFLCIL